MQLRKEHRSPAYEYIMIITRGDHAYRVDRSRGGPVFDTVTEQGIPPYDTVPPLKSTSLKGFDESSYCMIELCWGDDKVIDPSLILNICFQIHNKSGNKLLTHNCYFFSQTIITICVRKSVACSTELDKVLKRGMCDMTCKLCWEAVMRAAEHRHFLEYFLEYLLQDTLARMLGRELGGELGRALGWELGGS